MGLNDLQPGNTKRARATAVKVFAKFLKTEDVALQYVCECIANDTSGRVFVSVMDKFGMYLAFNEGKAGKQLARHTCMQYYRQAKHWLLDMFPQHRVALEAKLLKMGRTLESFCLKREGGGFAKKAAACTKGDLRCMMLYLYANARIPSDYQDAPLLCLLWYMFGRASDVTHVRKRSVSVDAGDVFFVRFIRMKTSEEQGLSLYSDADYATCPLLAIALALATQTAPSADLIGNLPAQAAPTQLALGDEPPLIELLDSPGAAATALAPNAASSSTPIAIHSHINRLLDRIARPAGVEEQLTPHSFRRGGAQHANGSSELTDRWIFDRGAWNVSTTNKAFNYVFNTRAEDHKVAKVLSGWRPSEHVPLGGLAVFDAQTREQIAAVRERLFATCWKMSSSRFCVSGRVLDVLTAHVLQHYPQLKQKHPRSPVVQRIEQCALDAQCSLADLLAWSSHIVASRAAPAQEEARRNGEGETKEETEEQKAIRHQATVVDHLIELAKRQDKRLDALEALVGDGARPGSKRAAAARSDETTPAKRRQWPAATALSTTWYGWYCREPRLWDAQGEKQRKSDAKMIVAYMKLFLQNFALHESDATYRDVAMSLGETAERGAIAFLEERAISARRSQSVLKHMRALHKAGVLNALIVSHKRLLVSGAIVDPASRHTHDVLESV